MKPTPTHFILGIIVLVLIAFTAYFRLEGLDVFQKKQAPLMIGPKNRFCVGVDHPETGLGIVCALGPDQVIDEAIRHLDVPMKCKEATVPPELKPGELIVLTETGGHCALEQVKRLPGPLRLMCGTRLSVNSDGIRDLVLLPGIGDVKAGRIVENRLRHGPFSNCQDLTRVRGIGPKTAVQLEPWLEW